MKLDKLKDAITEIKNKKQQHNNGSNEENKRHYLEFVGIALKEKLSFAQISAIGKYLREVSLNKNIDFLKYFSFDEEELSKLSRCFGTYMLNELKGDLEHTKFSLAIDSSTIAGENIWTLKVKYLDEFNENQNLIRTQIRNQVIGIKTLGERSTGETYLEIVKEKLLDLDEEIESNLLTITHDHASCFSSSKKD